MFRNLTLALAAISLIGSASVTMAAPAFYQTQNLGAVTRSNGDVQQSPAQTYRTRSEVETSQGLQWRWDRPDHDRS